jgi:integrase
MKKQGTYPLKLRINYLGEVRTYLCNYDLTKEEFIAIQSITNIKKYPNPNKRDKLREVFDELQVIKGKVAEIIRKMDQFNYQAFEKKYGMSDLKSDKVYDYYDILIKKYKKEGRIGTATSYETSRNSLKKFSPNLRFSNTTIDFLQEYENWLTVDQECSISTVGIYLRPLRTVLNYAIDLGIISRDTNYPFGKRRYQIPESNNTKKALTHAELRSIFKYEAFPTSQLEKSKDMFLFSFFGNGINMKDVALLKWKDLQNDRIVFTREKSKNTKRNRSKGITIILTPEMNEIIDRWKSKKSAQDDYIFSILEKNLTPEQIQGRVKQFTKMTNKGLKVIANDLGIQHNLTTYYARHSFATILKRSGTSIAEISESLGHSSLKTTESYLDSFDDESKIANAKKLQNFINSDDQVSEPSFKELLALEITV